MLLRSMPPRLALAILLSASTVSAADVAGVSSPVGMPTSADFIRKAPDPRSSMGYQNTSAYSAMKRLPNGHMIVFGQTHDPLSGANAVTTYDPVADAWTVRIPHTKWNNGSVLPDGTHDVRGRDYLGNRDNQVNIVLPGGIYYVNDGQRGIDFTGNYSGWIDTTASKWKWNVVDDRSSNPLLGANPATVWNGVGQWIDALNTGVFYGSLRNEPGDYLAVITPTPNGPNKFSMKVWSNMWGSPSFPGSVLLRYMSQSNWVRGDKLHIYGGVRRERGTLADTPNQTIYELDLTVPNSPVMRAVSTNTLGADAVKGDGILGDYYAAKDMAVITDGRRVNVYAYASATWVNVPIKTPPDANRNSPTDEGTGLQARFAPEIGQLIILGKNGATFGLRLNFANSAGSTVR
jgi:hypothetical protein